MFTTNKKNAVFFIKLSFASHYEYPKIEYKKRSSKATPLVGNYIFSMLTDYELKLQLISISSPHFLNEVS